jgi:hypothetical protein
MSPNLFITLYGIGILVTFIGLVLTVLKRGNKYSDMLPGKVYKLLGDLGVLLQRGIPDSEIDEKIDQMKRELATISEDMVKYIKERFPEAPAWKDEKKKNKILQNICVCLQSFLNQVKADPERDRMNVVQYGSGVRCLVKTINRYFADKDDEDTFIKRIIRCKEKIYFSLLGNPYHDPKLTADFVNDFSISADRVYRDELALDKYLNTLKEKWIGKPENLRGVKDEFILPLFTAWNMLSYCKRIKATVRIKDILELTFTERWKEIIYMGLTYDKEYKNIVEETYEKSLEHLKEKSLAFR